MNMTLSRTDYLETGIFGKLDSDDESLSLFSLEHSYPQGDPGSETYVPKIPAGTYTCQRGTHQLQGMIVPFETFEIMNVPNHTNCLIHVGNTQQDSSGCVLVGLFRSGNDSIMQSRTGFKLFMDLQDGINEFILTVI